MVKKLKNELFRVAVDYLFRKKKVGSQKELAEKIGITEPSLSRVMNGSRIVSDKTLHKMNEAFGGIFNMAYFRGEDPHCMLMEDLAYYKQHPEERLIFEKNPQEPTQPLPDDNAFMMSKVYESLVKPIEAAHAQQVASLNQQIADKQTIIDLQADKIKSQADEIARLQKGIDELRAMPSSYDIEEYIRNNPFPVGVADNSTPNPDQV